MKASKKLQRTTFRTSREMDFFSEKELVTQTGHEIGEWPLVIIKELIDNALDACEEMDIAPVIEVTADEAGISVRDNGPGIPEATLQTQLDFTVRASNREAYVSPCRGAQGNALKTLLPMPYVVDQDHGKLIVEAHGKRHMITCGSDPISQRAVVNDEIAELPKSKNLPSCNGTIKLALSAGTMVRLQWNPRTDDDETLWPFGDLCVSDQYRNYFPEGFRRGLQEGAFPSRFRRMMCGFALFNPHATFQLDWFGDVTTWKATNPAWAKWKPGDPTSPHWYEKQHLERLVGAYITHDRAAGSDRLVSDFLSEFDGLTGSAKCTKVLDAAGLKRAKLSELVVAERLDSKRIGRLLAAMQENTRPVNSRRLGIIGEEHLRARLLEMGCLPESFRYSRKLSDGKSKNSQSCADEKASFIPWVLESAFGYLGDATKYRKIFAGANWSAAIKNPFRSFGSTGVGLEATLTELKAGAEEPIIFVIHLAHPRVEYTDRGKSALIIGGAA